jgi:hypothetical protein
MVIRWCSRKAMNNLFDLYSNAGEYQNPYPDMFGRARHYNSANRTIFSPEVSKDLYSNGFRPYYPDNKKFAVCLSHDIDHLYTPQRLQRKMLNLAKGVARVRVKESLNNLKGLAKTRINPDYDLKYLIGINKQYKVRSTYYFLSLRRGEQDFNYSLTDIDGQLSAVLQDGNEIGLHGGHEAYNDAGKLAMEKKALELAIGREVSGYRNHFLRFEFPTTWQNLEKEHFLYDSTLGYPDCIGFRNGMCYPFYPYDRTSGSFMNLVELPLMIMDATLFYYMRLDADTAFKMCKAIIDQVKTYQGVLTLLWHNNFLTGEMGSVYLKILDYLKSEDPWYTTSQELVEWWKNESLLEKSKAMVREYI